LSQAEINALIPSEDLPAFELDFGGGVVGIEVLVPVDAGEAGVVGVALSGVVCTGFPSPSRTGFPLPSVTTVDALLAFTAAKLVAAGLNDIIFSP